MEEQWVLALKLFIGFDYLKVLSKGGSNLLRRFSNSSIYCKQSGF
jgi:hypothetical protein